MTDGSARPTVQEVETKVLDFLHRELVGSEVTVGRRDDLLSGEILDSIGVLRLATFLEQEFQMKIPPASFVIENFRSVEVLAGFVCETMGAASG